MADGIYPGSAVITSPGAGSPAQQATRSVSNRLEQAPRPGAHGLDPARIAKCYGVPFVLDYGETRGGGLLISTGAGLLMADMDQLPNVRWAVDIGPSRGRRNVAPWAEASARLVTHTVAHLWMALTSPAWMAAVLAPFPPDRLAVCSHPPLPLGYQADGIDALAEWSNRWAS